ncbi:TetR/AcrR family transcriptional regulator [Nocardia sp. NEAU-G5]|uniref:TetR/AcrR family transcriptional regulator n=1 Tax=Nocardia albiluteola TaxID=2842303 RepID=A0ABS6AV25_9NOCA|nr:TetR/AcrR family transcriptional regulator [Nocardia albiluteola]MBU3061881.1 TetR/AcrR family transcriptional regulator [Nocardia albiluteola]
MHPKSDRGVHRRRGSALQEALLSAAWAVLRENGYAGFTLEAVANRAGTSRPVIARRWATRQELLDATIAHVGAQRGNPTPDTGSLRGDLIALLRRANNARLDLATMLGVQLGGYYQETGRTLADMREALIGGHDHALDDVLAAGVERGEIDPDRLIPRIRALPMDLLRHHVLMTLEPMPEEGIEQIVDMIFLPLVRPTRGSDQ